MTSEFKRSRGAIVNTDYSAYKAAKVKKSQQQDKESLTNRVEILEKLVESLLETLNER